MKLFYSWQSDTPNKIGRRFIREALDEAVDQLNADLDLDEADRFVVDQDTQGKLGSPPIADTIFAKIAEADVVIADVTLVAQTPEGKKGVNSNVAIELGYALGTSGDEVLLKVMNRRYGTPEELPFDLRHRRWPTQFSISPDASKTEIAAEKKKLAKSFLNVLKEYSKKTPKVKNDGHIPIPSTLNPASHWEKDEKIINQLSSYIIGSDEKVELGYDDEPLVYLRIWPQSSIPPLRADLLRDDSTLNDILVAPLGFRHQGYLRSRNKYGLISYSDDGSGNLLGTTQVFKNGEIWGVNKYLCRIIGSQNDNSIQKIIPSISYEEDIIRSLEEYLTTAWEHFDYPEDVCVQSGIVMAAGFHIAMGNNYYTPNWGPIHDDEVISNAIIERSNPETAKQALLDIFNTTFNATGLPRPDNFRGFPAPEQD